MRTRRMGSNTVETQVICIGVGKYYGISTSDISHKLNKFVDVK